MNILNWDARNRKGIQTKTHDNSKFCSSYNEYNWFLEQNDPNVDERNSERKNEVVRWGLNIQ